MDPNKPQPQNSQQPPAMDGSDAASPSKNTFPPVKSSAKPPSAKPPLPKASTIKHAAIEAEIVALPQAVPVGLVEVVSEGKPTEPPISAELVATEVQLDNETQPDNPNNNHQTSAPPKPSWVFRVLSFIGSTSAYLFGIASIIFLLAVAANIPILQFLSFGYLLEVTGRLARNQKVSQAMIGLRKASILGGIVLGTWLCLLPIRLVSNFWYQAYLIDAASSQTQLMRVLQFAVAGSLVAHIGAAWFCGGKLRYFFWPFIAPFSFATWTARKLAGVSLFRKFLSITTGWFAPRLADDICNAPPITDWFLPAVFFKRLFSGQVYQRSRDSVWDFFTGLNLPYYFWFGLQGFIGSFCWLLIPTLLMVISTFSKKGDGVAILTGLLGSLIAIPVFAMLPFIQAHFATDGKLRRFLEVRKVFQNFGRAPIAHVIALLVTLVLALPLFFAKIESIPTDLLWSLSILFIVFTWPAKLIIGWAYRRGVRRERPSRWWLRYPIISLSLPVSFSFVLIFLLTRYVSWNGAFSLFENHVYLLPAPFWQ